MAVPRTDGSPRRGRIPRAVLHVCTFGSVGFGGLDTARGGCRRSPLDVPEWSTASEDRRGRRLKTEQATREPRDMYGLIGRINADWNWTSAIVWSSRDPDAR